MRIISGKYKARRFSLPKNFKARPTTDIAKESLFNVLNNRIDWEETQALDLFGGTGSIALEFVSRGCPSVICVEKDPLNYSFIEKTRKELKADELKVLKTDVFKFIENCNIKFDLIFADPPFDLAFFNDVVTRILDKDMLKDGGTFIIEHPREFDFSELPLFSEQRVYGKVNFSFFEKKLA